MLGSKMPSGYQIRNSKSQFRSRDLVFQNLNQKHSATLLLVMTKVIITDFCRILYLSTPMIVNIAVTTRLIHSQSPTHTILPKPLRKEQRLEFGLQSIGIAIL